MHKNRLIGVAVTVALALPFAAQAADDSIVVIYGKLYPRFQIVSSSGATAAGVSASTLGKPLTGVNIPSHNEINSGNSRMGFKGSEDLGGGLKAIWQIEQNIRLDTGGTSFADRSSFVGLRGKLGTIRLGRERTPYRDISALGSFLDLGGGQFYTEINLLSKPGFSSASSSSFHVRRNDMVRYDTPKFGGVQFLAMYSPDEAKTATKDADLWSYAVKYEAGPLYLALAHEIHNDFFGASKNLPALIANPTTGLTGVHSKDKGFRFTAGYEFGDTQVATDIARLEYKESGGATGRFESYKKTAYAIKVEQKFGKVTGGIGYTHSAEGSCTLVGGGACSTSGLDGKLINVGAKYAFSKRTWLFALYTKLINGNSAIFENLASGQPDPAPGSDISQFALGIFHQF